MNKLQTSQEIQNLMMTFLERGGKITVGKTRNKAPKFVKSMHAAAKRVTYGRSYDKQLGFKKVDYEFVGNNACGYNTKYVMN